MNAPALPEPSSAQPVAVAILALPEVSASVVYGMFDLFMSAGRDWGLIVEGQPGESRFAPRVVTADGAPLVVGNGVTIRPHASFEEGALPRIVCVPELLVATWRDDSMAALAPRLPSFVAAMRPAPRLPRRARAPCCWLKPGCWMAVTPPHTGPTATS